VKIDDCIGVISASQTLNKALLSALGNHVVKSVGYEHQGQWGERGSSCLRPLLHKFFCPWLPFTSTETFAYCNQNL